MKEQTPKEMVRGPNGKLVEGKAPAPVAKKPNPIMEALTRPVYRGAEGERMKRRSGK